MEIDVKQKMADRATWGGEGRTRSRARKRYFQDDWAAACKEPDSEAFQREGPYISTAPEDSNKKL